LLGAADLTFPKTEAEIVKALKLKDAKTTFNGTEYVSEGGSVYKIIGTKRYQMRGLESIVDADITPKEGLQQEQAACFKQYPGRSVLARRIPMNPCIPIG
jgi:hypothetical protein